MGRDLDIVVTCTDRKSLTPHKGVRVRDLPCQPDGSPSFEDWVSRLSGYPGDLAAARDLYQGETWTVGLELERIAREVRSGPVRTWVLSAGYGIIDLDTELAPYSATFSPASPDFVGGALEGRAGTNAARQWWRRLCANQSAQTGPTSLEDVATAAAGDVLLVLSSAYLRACHRDVVRAVSKNKRTIVLAPSAQGSRAIQHAAPPFDARLLTTRQDRESGIRRPILEGSRMSLNGRVAQLLVENFGDRAIDRAEASRFLAELTESQPPLATYDREDRSDEAVRRFIRQRLTEDPTVTKTGLLREFRDSGNRCEQKRFGGLFASVKDHLDLAESA